MRVLRIGTALLVLVAGCQAPTARHGSRAGAADTAACRAVDQGPKVADRGIGGTGIGAGTAIADRGIGGTGIVGTITGFASVCLDGVRVAVDAGTEVRIDGARLSAEALRLGQVAAITAEPAGPALRAQRIEVAHAVSGQVEEVAPDGTSLRIARQTVLLDGALRSAAPSAGAWLAVSGLIDPDGRIHATRLESRAPGETSVSGTVEAAEDAVRVGALRLQGAVPVGAGPVLVTGSYSQGVLSVIRVAPIGSPAGDVRVGRLLVQGFAELRDGRLRLGGGIEAKIGARFGPPPPVNRAAFVRFERGADGGLLAVGWGVSVRGSRGADPSLTVPAPKSGDDGNGTAGENEGGSSGNGSDDGGNSGSNRSGGEDSGSSDSGGGSESGRGAEDGGGSGSGSGSGRSGGDGGQSGGSGPSGGDQSGRDGSGSGSGSGSGGGEGGGGSSGKGSGDGGSSGKSGGSDGAGNGGKSGPDSSGGRSGGGDGGGKSGGSGKGRDGGRSGGERSR